MAGFNGACGYHAGVALRAEWSSVSASINRAQLPSSPDFIELAMMAVAWPWRFKMRLKSMDCRQPPRIWGWVSLIVGQNSQKLLAVGVMKERLTLQCRFRILMVAAKAR